MHPLGAEAPAAVPPVTLAAAPPEDPYPRCTHLIRAYQSQANSQNKTPLAVLHEYAVRFNLEVWHGQQLLVAPPIGLLARLLTDDNLSCQILYTESAESSLGPFTVETKLCLPNGSVTSDVATGQAGSID